MPKGIARLKIRKDFLRLSAGRKKFVAPGLILQALPQQASPGPTVLGVENIDSGILAEGQSVPSEPKRLGFTATKKIGNAVIRNRARRRLRAASDAIMTRHAAEGHDYVLIARRETVDRDWPSLLADLERALRHLRVYRS